jgi:stage V sporulation protein AA
MSHVKDTLFIKFDKNKEVTKPDITLGDVGTFTCQDPAVLARVKAMHLVHAEQNKKGRFVFSVLKVIEMIQKEYPSLDIQNMGEVDFIVTYEDQKQGNKIWHGTKVVMIVLITFFGAAFSIMAFNNDVTTTKLFGQVYTLLTGAQSDGFTVLEVSYSVGIAIGILVFFNHFLGRNMTEDPTPMEIEMRTYEEDIQKTLIEAYGRKGKKSDVGSSDRAGSGGA